MPVMVWHCCPNCHTLNETVLLWLLDEDVDALQCVNGAVVSENQAALRILCLAQNY